MSALTGVQWHPGTLPAGDKLLSLHGHRYLERLHLAHRWLRRRGADTTSTPMAAHSYIPGHADAGLYLQVVEKATEVIETDPATFTFRIRHTTVTATSTGTVASYPAGAKPWSSFVNGLPERETGSNSEIFQVSPAHFNQADGTPTVSYQIDGGTLAAPALIPRLCRPARLPSAITGWRSRRRTAPARRSGRSPGG